MLYSRIGLAVSGQALQHSTFTLAFRNASSIQRSNYSLLTEVLTLHTLLNKPQISSENVVFIGKCIALELI